MSGRAISFGPSRHARRPSLTPLIDVVFLLLVFFMLASRFGAETGIALSSAGQGGDPWTGPPRLVSVRSDSILLNGNPVDIQSLEVRLAPLMPSPGSPVVLRAETGVSVDRLTQVLGSLRAAGFVNVVLVE